MILSMTVYAVVVTQATHFGFAVSLMFCFFQLFLILVKVKAAKFALHDGLLFWELSQ